LMMTKGQTLTGIIPFPIGSRRVRMDSLAAIVLPSRHPGN
jgi:hypothetical protein